MASAVLRSFRACGLVAVNFPRPPWPHGLIPGNTVPVFTGSAFSDLPAVAFRTIRPLSSADSRRMLWRPWAIQPLSMADSP